MDHQVLSYHVLSDYYRMRARPDLLKIYTKTGDSGTTGLQGGGRVSKADPRIMAYGALDEANAILGMILAAQPEGVHHDTLRMLQNDIFVLGADLSNPNMGDDRVRTTPEMTTNLERLIDQTEETLPQLTNFILPGGTATGSLLHLARTVVRRAETHLAAIRNGSLNPECHRYVNRLSDLLFVLARSTNMHAGMQESTWTPE